MRVHPHGQWHTHAAQLLAEGVDIGIISKQLGHRSIASTVRYLDHITLRRWWWRWTSDVNANLRVRRTGEARSSRRDCGTL